MNQSTRPMRDFAGRLIAHEAHANKSSGTTTAAVFPVSDTLRSHLMTLMGNDGFRALLSRSLALAGSQVPWLRSVRVKADGTLEWLAELPKPPDPDELFEGRVVLLAQVLELLVAFIGENLTLRLAREIWPKVPINHSDFVKGDKNEKTQ